MLQRPIMFCFLPPDCMADNASFPRTRRASLPHLLMLEIDFSCVHLLCACNRRWYYFIELDYASIWTRLHPVIAYVPRVFFLKVHLQRSFSVDVVGVAKTALISPRLLAYFRMYLCAQRCNTTIKCWCTRTAFGSSTSLNYKLQKRT